MIRKRNKLKEHGVAEAYLQSNYSRRGFNIGIVIKSIYSLTNSNS